MENLSHIIVKIGPVREDYYFDGNLTYHDVNGIVYECSKCGKRIGEDKLFNKSFCPYCGVKFEGVVSNGFKEKCNALITYYQKRKATIKEQMDRSHKKEREELRKTLHGIEVNLHFVHEMLRILQNGEISYEEFELCEDMYYTIINGGLRYY